MKFSDLNAGMLVYVCEKYFWEKFHESPERCQYKVLDTKRYARSSRINYWTESPTGRMVMVAKVHETGLGSKEFINIMFIRGEYGIIRARRELEIQEHNEKQRSALQLRDRQHEVIRQVEVMLSESGLPSRVWMYRPNGIVSIHIDTLVAALGAKDFDV